ncbi:MAG: patatin-like phospholipase family protein [Methylococcaceae bacterium]
MLNDEKKIGLALSGGGIRAAVFHSGVLKYLAEKGMLEQVSFISTVSGASLLVGLIYEISKNKFPSSKEYLEDVFPEIEKLLTSKNLQITAIKILIKSFFCPPNWGDLLNRGNILAKALKCSWKIVNNLQDISDYPRWVINGTTQETGKCWRFSKERMGDYKTGYVINPDILIADAIAASAAFPPYIDHYKLNVSSYSWKHYEKDVEFKNAGQPIKVINPNMRSYHITDGGIYDNLATEAVFKKFGEELRDNINYLIISDAGSALDIREVHLSIFSKTIRNFDIIMAQVVGLRLRAIFRFFRDNQNTGVIVKIGSTIQHLLEESKKIETANKIKVEVDDFLIDEDVKKAAEYPTDLNKIIKQDFNLISRHGYETTKIQMSLYCKS